MEDMLWEAGFNQLIVPGIFAYYSVDNIRSRLLQQTTHYLFTWGAEETGVYKLEADEKITCIFLQELDNVECDIHSGGHVFPEQMIAQFLERYVTEPE